MVAEGLAGCVPVPGEGRLRVCPRCGAKLFADMSVCYGCLYDFSKEGPEAPPGMGELGVSLGERLLAVDEEATEIWGSLDELVPEGDPATVVGSAPVAVGSALAAADGSVSAAFAANGAVVSRAGASEGMVPAGTPECVPRAGASELTMPAEAGWAATAPEPCPDDDGCRLTMCLEPACEGAEVRVRVAAPGFAATCSVPQEGLSVGRDLDNDVSVGSLAVSRHHLRLVPVAGGVVAQDLGATNPALLNGHPLVGGVPMRAGDVLELRGCGVTIRPQHAEGP